MCIPHLSITKLVTSLHVPAGFINPMPDSLVVATVILHSVGGGGDGGGGDAALGVGGGSGGGEGPIMEARPTGQQSFLALLNSA